MKGQAFPRAVVCRCFKCRHGNMPKQPLEIDGIYAVQSPLNCLVRSSRLDLPADTRDSSCFLDRVCSRSGAVLA